MSKGDGESLSRDGEVFNGTGKVLKVVRKELEINRKGLKGDECMWKSDQEALNCIKTKMFKQRRINGNEMLLNLS